jgi:diguanylate cyclase (GGDEF)-like protein
MSSPLARRLFGVFLVAAAIPALLLGVLVQTDSYMRERQTQQVLLGNTLRWLTNQTLERLLLAQSQLHALTDGSTRTLGAYERLASGRDDPDASFRALSDVVQVMPDGQLIRHYGQTPIDPKGDPRILHRPANARPGHDRVVTPRDVAGGPGVRDILIAHDAPDGSVWLGRVDPDFLWRYSSELTPGLRVCAHAAGLGPMWCSDAISEGDAVEVGSRAQHGRSETRELFLASRFEATSWFFVADAESTVTLWSTRAQVPAALAALLMAVLLTATQLQRTMRPLQQLSEAARAWAEGRLGTRLPPRGGDEFAPLVNTFNDMAQRLEDHFRHLATLRRIDGTAISENDVDTALEAVARDLLVRWQTPRGVLCLARQVPSEEELWSVVAVAGLHVSRRGRCMLLDDNNWAGGVESGVGRPTRLPAGMAAWVGPTALSMMAWPLVVHGRIVGLIAMGTSPEELRLPAGTCSPGSLTTEPGFVEIGTRLALALDALLREGRLRHDARHDSLTGLPNRAGMLERLEAALSQAGAGGSPVSVLFIDLDRFKSVNDGHGHQVGDKRLQLVAERLVRLVGKAGFVSRPAGDEFVVVIDRPLLDDMDLDLARAVCSELAQRLTIGTLSVQIGASIGLARGPADSLDAAELLRMADVAMYEAKRSGRNRTCRYEPSLDAVAQRRLWIETELGDAITRNELMLLYQPRLDVRAGNIGSAEALVRWVHPKRGLVSPGEFIPVAEESALIERVGTWVLEQACAQLAAWRSGPMSELRVAVNVSARQLASDRFVVQLHKVLRRYGIAPHRLELEVTESLLADDIDSTVRRLQAIRDLGVTLALDDFGTGYSSLSYLRRLPVDIMKIDRSFVIDIPQVRSANAVAHSIVALANALGKTIVAEGVETPQQAQWLREAGCQELQGYLFGKPMPPEELAARIAAPTAITAAFAEPSIAQADPEQPWERTQSQPRAPSVVPLTT